MQTITFGQIQELIDGALVQSILSDASGIVRVIPRTVCVFSDAMEIERSVVALFSKPQSEDVIRSMSKILSSVKDHSVADETLKSIQCTIRREILVSCVDRILAQSGNETVVDLPRVFSVYRTAVESLARCCLPILSLLGWLNDGERSEKGLQEYFVSIFNEEVFQRNEIKASVLPRDEIRLFRPFIVLVAEYLPELVLEYRILFERFIGSLSDTPIKVRLDAYSSFTRMNLLRAENYSDDRSDRKRRIDDLSE